MMTVGELKEMLEDLDDDMEVRLAHQPSWPFEYSISNGQVVDVNEPDEDDEEAEEKEPREILYLIEGSQLGYLPGIVSQAIGWK